MGGKSSPPPPDYSGMEALGREQLEFSKQQYAEMKPLAERVYGLQMQSQQQQMDQAKDYYDYQKSTFRPLELGLVKQAQEFNTDSYREQLAAKAAADAAKAFGATQAASQRSMAAMGVNPNSGRGMALQTQANLGLAAQRAGAMTGARQQAEQLGWARQMDVTGLGRGLAGASTAAYGGATSAGTAGLNSAMAPGNQYMQGLQQAGGTMGTVLNSQTSAYNAGLQQADPFATIVGMGIGGWAGGGFKGSDRRIKENIELIGRDERTGLNLYEFEYKGGSGKRFVGVMADEVESYMPEAVYTMPDGFKAVNYTLLGIEMNEVAHG